MINSEQKKPKLMRHHLIYLMNRTTTTKSQHLQLVRMLVSGT